MAGFSEIRFEENLKKNLSLLIRNLKNLKDRAPNLSVSRVEVKNAGNLVRVFVSSIKGVNDVRCVIKNLNNASGFIKRKISNKLKLKAAPQLEFLVDDFVNYSDHINEILNKLKVNER